MLPNELIGYISNYTTDTNAKLLNHSIYLEVENNEISQEWYDKYNNYFKTNNISIPLLKGNYLWKQEYCVVSTPIS